MRASTPRRVAVVHSNPDYLANMRLPLMRELARRGYQVLGFSPHLKDEHRETLAAEGIEAVEFTLDPVGLNPLRDLRDTLRLAKIFRSHALDVVLTNTAKPVIFGSFAAALAGVPARYAMVTGLGSSLARTGGLKQRALRSLVSLLYRISLSLNERVIFHNNDDIAELAGARVIDARRALRVNGSGVELDRWVFERPQRQNPVTYLFIGRLLREKGVVELVDATRVLRDRGHSLRCILVGDCDRNPTALRRDEVRAWVEEGIVEWPGHQRDLGPWLQRADVFVLPSYREGLPHSALQAMASGLPVVTSDCPGCRDVVCGSNGILVPPGNSAALASAMLRFIEEPGLAREMGRHSRRLAAEKFDVHRVNNAMIAAMDLGFCQRSTAEPGERAAVQPLPA